MRQLSFIVTLLFPLVTLSHSIPSVARISKAIVELDSISAAIEIYSEKNGYLPTANEGLSVLIPSILPRLPMDPWGRSYIYKRVGNRYVVGSYGRDGVSGGDGEDYDFSSDTPLENEDNKDLERQKSMGLLNWYIAVPIMALFLFIILAYVSLVTIVNILRRKH